MKANTQHWGGHDELNYTFYVLVTRLAYNHWRADSLYWASNGNNYSTFAWKLNLDDNGLLLQIRWKVRFFKIFKSPRERIFWLHLDFEGITESRSQEKLSSPLSTCVLFEPGITQNSLLSVSWKLHWKTVLSWIVLLCSMFEGIWNWNISSKML